MKEWKAAKKLADVLIGFGLLVVSKLVIGRPLIYGCTMSLTIEPTQAVPLTQGKDGVFRITGSRVRLDSIVHQFQSGATAEQIQEDFPSVSLGDIYAVIAWFLQRAHAVEDYLNEQPQAGAQVRREVEGGMDARGLREHLRRRRGPCPGKSGDGPQRTAPVGQTFLSAGSGDIPVARRDTGLESPVNRQAGKPAPRSGSGVQSANWGWEKPHRSPERQRGVSP